MEVRARIQDALSALQNIATSQEWSQRKLAEKIGIKESTLRKIKCGRADVFTWLPKLEAAITRLTSSFIIQPSTFESEVTA